MTGIKSTRMLGHNGAATWAVMALLVFAASANAEPQTTFPVDVIVDAAKSQGPLSRAWSYFGGDEPNYATMKDGETLLDSLGKLNPGHVYIRAHHLMTSGDGTPALKWGSTNIYSEDKDGNPVYDYTIVDHIFDTYLKHGVKPYVQLGFMPQALSSNPDPYRSDWRPGLDYGRVGKGVSYPPKDYGKWGDLVFNWIQHCIDRYGRSEVETWYFETWNEANGRAYWKGTDEEFYKLHDTSVAAVRRVLPNARVGGPDMAGSGSPYFDNFIGHLNTAGTPTDFLSFHAKGSPTYIGDHVRMNMVPQLAGANHGFEVVASDPMMRDKPIVIGESDPEGCAACLGPQLGYRNGTMYSSYTAASFPRIVALAKRNKVHLEGVLTWAFEFEDQPYFAGFRQLMSNGIDLPVLNVFRMYSKMSGDEISAVSSAQVPLDEVLKDGVKDHPDVGVLAARSDKDVTIMIWHYFDEDVLGPAAHVNLSVRGLPKSYAKGARLIQYRIDDAHSNAYAVWKKMGSPLTLNDTDFDLLKAQAGLQEMAPAAAAPVTKDEARLSLDLPRQGVALFVLTPATNH